jgi:hypothetical protein
VSTRTVTVGDRQFELAAEPPRTSLTDDAHTLWGFNVEVRENGAPVAIKTCFVGRVTVQARHPEALQGTAEDIARVVHQMAFDKIEEGLASGDVDDALVFA